MKPQLPILALGHTSRVGKDTAARAIVEAIQGAERVAFATKLKAVAAQLFGRYGLKGEDHYERNPEDRTVKLPRVGKTPVELWIETGNKLREVYPDLWIDLALDQAFLNPVKLLVVSDLRFPNEAKAIKDRGGWCVKVNRPHGEVINASDDLFPDDFAWDAELNNLAGLDSFKKSAVRVAQLYLKHREAFADYRSAMQSFKSSL